MKNNFGDFLMDSVREMTRKKLGLDVKSPQELFDIAYKIVDLLPREKMSAHAAAQAKSGSPLARLQAKQLGILLFAGQEMEKCLSGLSREDQEAIMRELTLG